MQKNILSRLLTILMLSSSMVACGWQLRGSQDDATYLTEINLGAGDIYTKLYRTFKQECEHRQIKLVSNESAPHLHLINEKQSDRVVSYNTELDPAEDEVTLTISYLINNQPFTLEEKQTSQRNKNRIAARENEREILVEQMRKQMAIKILRQVDLIHRTPAPAPAASTP